MIKTIDFGVLTFAYGKKEYIDEARTLAISIKRFSPNLSISLVTDCHDKDLAQLFDIIIPADMSLGSNLVQKLYIDLYTPYQKTIFIDSDCIVVEDIEYIFDELSGGTTIIPDGTYLINKNNPRGVDFFKLEKELGISEFREFNGGIYYVEKNTLSEETFKKGRELLKNYKSYGIPDFRKDGPNDEFILGIACTLLENKIIITSKPCMRFPWNKQGEISIDVVKGYFRFSAENVDFSPSIIHYASLRHHKSYSRESRKLRILASNILAKRSIAHLYGLWFNFYFEVVKLTSFLKFNVWNIVPKPFRLFYHGVNNFFKTN